MPYGRVDEILEFAEKEIRKGGIDAVSFRDIASQIGIKSASVHYHFPTKADLTQAVALRYAERFLEALGSPDGPAESARERLERLCDGYIAAYEQDGSACLCAVLGSVSPELPEETSDQIAAFYRRLGAWIEAALAGAAPRMTPGLIISLLQGAMILSIATGNDEQLLDAKRHLMASALS